MAKIYLIPSEYATYVSCVSDDAPSADAIFLVEEGVYPTVAWHQRHDLNMDAILMREEIENRDDLITYLDFLGKCRHKVLRLWNHDVDNGISEDLAKLFDKCHNRKAELIAEEMLKACEGMEDVEDIGFEIIDEPDENFPF